jgi:mRNA-degrading endonuclease RelE of RelBE toxin-antitoxin system
MELVIHPRVGKYIQNSGEKERIVSALKSLSINGVSSMDVKQLKGKKHDMFRLRVGDHRFEFFIEDNKIWVDEAFRRGRGYR